MNFKDRFKNTGNRFFGSGLGIFLVLFVVSGLSLVLLFIAQDWPVNHESDSFFLRTMVYADHMRQGDFFPVWSAADNFGFGSPQPLWYHKLFYLVSGTFYLFLGISKQSVIFALWFFLLIGSVGMYVLARTIGFSRVEALCAGIMLILANYTITNWLIRGAMAELSGAMLVPWCIHAYINLIKQKYNDFFASFYLGLIVALIYFSHSVLAYFLVLLLCVTSVILICTRKISINRNLIVRVLLAAIIFAVIIAPFLLIIHSISKDYDLTRILPPFFLPENQFRPFRRYFWNRWTWGKGIHDITLQLDKPVLLMSVTGIIYAIVLRWKKIVVKWNITLESIVIGSLIILPFILQTKRTIPFYRYFPGANFIQFPWRLMAIITPMLILFSIMIWRFLSPKKAVFLVVAATASMFCFSGAFRPIKYENFKIPETQTLDYMQFSWYGEYVPVSAGKTDFSTENVYATAREKGCTIKSRRFINSNIQDNINLEYDLNCQKEGEYPLPIFGSPLHRLHVDLIKKEKGYPDTKIDSYDEICVSSNNYPGLCVIKIKKPGFYQVEVRNPTMFRFLFQ